MPEDQPTTGVVCGYKAAGHPCEHDVCPEDEVFHVERSRDDRFVWKDGDVEFEPDGSGALE